MKRSIRTIICCIGAMAALLLGCNDDRSNLQPTGVLYLDVEEDATLLTKAQTEATYESLRVDILKGEEDTLRTYTDYLTEVKEQRLVLPVGTYAVAVRSNNAEKAAWETPLYAGSEEVEVKQGEITNTRVVCHIANTKVSVIYNESVKEHFLDYQTTVSNSSGSLTYTRDEYRSGYFIPEKLSVRLNLTNHDGNEFVIKSVYPDILPQYHYKFVYTVESGDGDSEAGSDFNVTVDEEHQEINYTIFIKEEEEGFGSAEPAIALSGFTDGSVTYRENAAIKPEIGLVYKIGSKCNLISAVVTTSSPTFAKAGLTQFDLMNSEESQKAQVLGFPALPSQPSDANEAYDTFTWNLSELSPYLEAVDLKATEHLFTLRLTDDRHQETSASFTIRVMPDVDASVNEPICWSTFAVLQGNSLDETIYFKLKGANDKIIDIPKEKIKHDADGNVSALITNLMPGVQYSYWLASEMDENMECTPEDFTVEPPSIVPNLNFENWGIRKGTMTILGAASTKEYISPNDNNSDVYWDSGNLGAVAGNKVLTEGTTETALPSSGKAAKLVSAYPSQIGIGAFAAGSIYSGKAKDVSSSGAVLMYGCEYKGFPTKLRGYYKYEPATINYTDSRCPVNMEGKMDEGIIYVALIPEKFEVTSKTSGSIVAFSKKNANAFAYGEYILTGTKNETGKEAEGLLKGYVPFEITLEYEKDIPVGQPFYIVIVATSSRYGDYFTGAVGSTLYIDDFELGYDYEAASFSHMSIREMIPINIESINE